MIIYIFISPILRLENRHEQTATDRMTVQEGGRVRPRENMEPRERTIGSSVAVEVLMHETHGFAAAKAVPSRSVQLEEPVMT